MWTGKGQVRGDNRPAQVWRRHRGFLGRADEPLPFHHSHHRPPEKTGDAVMTVLALTCQLPHLQQQCLPVWGENESLSHNYSSALDDFSSSFFFWGGGGGGMQQVKNWITVLIYVFFPFLLVFMFVCLFVFLVTSWTDLWMYMVVVVVVAFSLHARIWGKCSTTYSQPTLFFF